VSGKGDSILVGAPAGRSGEGLSYLFTRINGAWVRRQVLSSDGNAPNCASCPTPSVRMGMSVRVMNGVLASGADGTTTGSAKIAAGSVELLLDRTVAGPATVSASDGTYKDKVQITWSDNFGSE